MDFLRAMILILLSFLPALAFEEPLILQVNESQLKERRCRSWRVAGEANNLASWKTIPEECADYVKDYMTGEDYELDLETVSGQAELFARSLDLDGDHRKLAWIFDVDETLLSNLPYYEQHGYGLEVFDDAEFDKWVEMGVAPAIEPCLKLYKVVDALGFRILLLTGRSERHRNITVTNLLQAGFPPWDRLIMRGSEDHGKSATRYKSQKRRDLIEADGYELAGNSGDQWSDLLDSHMSLRSFKLPNPMYYIH